MTKVATHTTGFVSERTMRLTMCHPWSSCSYGSYDSCRTRGVARDLGCICELAASLATCYDVNLTKYNVCTQYIA